MPENGARGKRLTRSGGCGGYPMTTIACPGCGMPRADELIGTKPCPVCGATDTAPVTDAVTEVPAARSRAPRNPTADSAPLDLNPNRVHGSRLGIGIALGFALGIAAGVGGVLGWQTFGRANVASETATVGDIAAPVSPGQPVAAEVAPMPRELAARAVVPPPTPDPPVIADPAIAPPAMPPVAVAPLPPVAPAVVPPKPPVVVANGPAPEPAPANPFRPTAPAALLIDNPEGTLEPVVRPGRPLVLRGRIKTLHVRGLDAGAILDCSELEAREVIVSGKIDGGSKLWLKAPDGTVTFLAKVDGRSTVGVYAPGGTVTFVNRTDEKQEGSKVDGGSTLDITAKLIQMHGRIHGPGTKVEATLTAGGVLSFAEIGGSARLEYGNADPYDPEPRLTKGKIGSGASVMMVE